MWRFLFGFRGRMSRAPVWGFSIAVAVLGMAVTFGIASLSTSPLPLAWSFAPFVGLNRFVADWSASPLLDRGVFIGARVFDLLVLFTSIAVITKRLHDRDKRFWWIVPFWVLPKTCAAILGYLSLTRPMEPIWTLPLASVAIIFGLWGFVEIYCFSGSYGENRFGPDPLGGPVVNPFQGEKAG